MVRVAGEEAKGQEWTYGGETMGPTRLTRCLYVMKLWQVRAGASEMPILRKVMVVAPYNADLKYQEYNMRALTFHRLSITPSTKCCD